MAKKRKKDMTKYYIWIGVLAFLGIILLVVYYSTSTMNRSMKSDGYTTEGNEDPFYKKITTGNTLDDYYNDLANEKDSAYEEYYLLKESYTFTEQKLFYQEGVSSALNINSDLRDLSTTFNYELSYQDVYILLEGSSENNYNCEVVMNKNVSKETEKNACEKIQEELDTFFVRRNEVMANEQVQELLQNALPVVAKNNYEE